MNPYLEASDICPDLHQRFAVALSEQLAPRLLPRYVALVHHDLAVEWVSEPDGEIRSGRRRADLSVIEGKPSAALAPLPPDPDVTIDLGAALAKCVASAGYELLLDYAAEPPAPALEPENSAFVRQCVAG